MNSDPDSIYLSDWEYLFNLATPAERKEITFLMLEKIEDRQEQVLNMCKANPKHLETLPAARLRDIAATVNIGGRLLLLASLHMSGDAFLAPVLDAYETLTAFNVSKDEPTASDLHEVIGGIKAVWDAEDKIHEENKGRARIAPACIDAPTAPITAAPGMDSRVLTALNPAQDEKHVGIVTASMVATDSAQGAGLRRLIEHRAKKKAVKKSARVSTETKARKPC